MLRRASINSRLDRDLRSIGEERETGRTWRMNSSLAGRGKEKKEKEKKNRFRFDERMWAGLIFCSSGIFALFDRILEIRLMRLFFLLDAVVYAVDWKGRLRYV